MSRRKGSKNRHASYYSVATLQKKSKALADAIDKYITVAYSNQQFNKLVDFNGLHETKDNLIDLSTLRIEP